MHHQKITRGIMITIGMLIIVTLSIVVFTIWSKPASSPSSQAGTITRPGQPIPSMSPSSSPGQREPNRPVQETVDPSPTGGADTVTVAGQAKPVDQVTRNDLEVMSNGELEAFIAAGAGGSRDMRATARGLINYWEYDQDVTALAPRINDCLKRTRDVDLGDQVAIDGLVGDCWAGHRPYLGDVFAVAQVAGQVVHSIEWLDQAKGYMQVVTKPSDGNHPPSLAFNAYWVPGFSGMKVVKTAVPSDVNVLIPSEVVERVKNVVQSS